MKMQACCIIVTLLSDCYKGSQMYEWVTKKATGPFQKYKRAWEERGGFVGVCFEDNSKEKPTSDFIPRIPVIISIVGEVELGILYKPQV